MKEIIATENEMKEYFDNYTLVFLKFYDYASNKMHVVGDVLVKNDISLYDLQTIAAQKHMRWIKTSCAYDESFSLSLDISIDQSQEVAVDSNQIKENNHKVQNSIDNDQNQFLSMYINDSSVQNMVFFEESGSKHNKNELKVNLINEIDNTDHLQNGNIFIYSFLTKDTSTIQMQKLIQSKYVELRTTVWVNLIEMESEFHQQNIILNKRMAVNTTSEFSENR